jgi:DNA-directed RNA polymerase subunit alpha
MNFDITGLVLPQRVEVAEVSEDGRQTDFVLQPLERGYGHTLGNSMRRVLLSSLRGAALWAFRADGVMHEHQTVAGVIEDVHQIIQNLKSLVVRLAEDVEEAKLELTVRSPGLVTAAQIEPHSAVTLVNPEHPLFTLTEELSEEKPFRMELFINKGRGFVLADQHPPKKDTPVDLIRIDSIYNPVTRVNFMVEETRVGQRTDFDRLTLTVETNGAVTPREAVRYGAELLGRHLAYFGGFDAEAQAEAAPRRTRWVPLDERVRDVIQRPLEDFDLSVRSRNTLEKGNIRTLGDVVKMTEDEMLRVENFGRKSLVEVGDLLREHGLHFGMKFQEGEDGELYLLEESADGEEEPVAGGGPTAAGPGAPESLEGGEAAEDEEA